MDNLSKEEKLRQQILKEEDIASQKKWKRTKRTFFVLSGVMYLIALYVELKGGISDINIATVCGLIFAPPLSAGFIMSISYLLLSYILSGAMEDEKTIAKLKGELNAIRYNNYKKE